MYEIDSIFDNKIELIAELRYNLYEKTTLLLAIYDITGNIITSAQTELKVESIYSTTITFEISKGYLRPSPMSIGFEILNGKGESVISYHNVANIPYNKKGLMSGYLNIPIMVRTN